MRLDIIICKFLTISLLRNCLKLFAQQKEGLNYVNPFIGTAKNTVASQWGVDGGTYPGAVAPFINFQTDRKSLSFFAGGWGRGSCSSILPENWFNNWHHIAGISDGVNLKMGKNKPIPFQ